MNRKLELYHNIYIILSQRSYIINDILNLPITQKVVVYDIKSIIKKELSYD
ncbi:hypothetical protein SAMN05421659_102388 [[Clostridium] fimetarium]|uniref:Uncharacterized protein n=1 Tax=[Clostridium] fimetarium TaxID=99656 RepID=A0A1I0N674_9FIRM|nr:hypothetical protein SAMN05421659_102388 [[Clostridium] fimetarium]